MSEKASVDPSKINPFDPVKKLYEMYLADMVSYTDPESGDLKKSIATEVSACPVCMSEHKASDKLFKKGPFSYWQCSRCTLVYVAPRLNDEATEALYTSGRCMTQLKEFYLPTAEYRKESIYRRKLREIESAKARGKLLDFGSSTGYFLQTAVEQGWDAYGIELNPYGVSWSKVKLGLKNIFNEDVRNCSLPKQSFDVITMWDVLEHLADPAGIVSILKSLLKPDGLIVIETSHYDCYETEILGKENTNIAGDIHLMHFTKKSLEAFTDRLGLSIKEIDIFGLDVSHILDFDKLTGSKSVDIKAEDVEQKQQEIDDEGRGCYIKFICTPTK